MLQGNISIMLHLLCSDAQTAVEWILVRLLAAGSCRQQPGIAVPAGSRSYSLTTVGYFRIHWQATVL